MMQPRSALSPCRRRGRGPWALFFMPMFIFLCFISPVSSGFDELDRLRALVERDTVCALPGCPMKLDRFVPLLQRAMSRGYVWDTYGEYVLAGFTRGFDLGVSLEPLRG